jgi:hypothetical protein
MTYRTGWSRYKSSTKDIAMTKQAKTAIVCGLTFAGDTVAIAKATGEREVTRLAREANLGPSVYRVGAMTMLVWPQLECWAWRCLEDGGDGLVRASCTMGGTREQACIDAVGAAGQRQWGIEIEDDAAYFAEAFAGIGQPWDASRRIAEEISLAGWQRRYRAAYDVCGDRNRAHDVATRTRSTDEACALVIRETAVAA